MNIKNTGGMDSDEVPQVYLGAPAGIPDGLQFPVCALVAFDRVQMKKGGSRRSLFTLRRASFSTGRRRKADGSRLGKANCECCRYIT